MTRVLRLGWVLICLGLLLWTTPDVRAENRLRWDTQSNLVDAELVDRPLADLLGEISKLTGWEVFVEPDTTATVSAKFKKLGADEALHRLLGKISYARCQTNGVTRLLVYKSRAQAATQLVRTEPKEDKGKSYLIPNELIVRLKKNSSRSIEELAKKVNGKIVGRNDRLKLYRLEFADAAAAEAARRLLLQDEEVAGLDSNFRVDPPAPTKITAASFGTQFHLDPKELSGCSKLVGLIDTAIQPQRGMEDYLATPIYVVGQGAPPPTGEPTHATGMFETMLQGMKNSPGKVLPVVVFRDGEKTTSFEIVKGIEQAIEAGANPINLSLGGTGNSPTLGAIIAEAQQKGIVFVAAAGNEPVTTPTYPAAYPGVIAVTAASQNGQIAPYANSGDFVRAMAPGTSLVTLDGRTWMMQGTSVASAYVSGMIAAGATHNCAPPGQLADQIVAGLPVRR